MQDFQDRHRLAGIAISVNDMGATPAVVSLRLDQAAAALAPAAGAKP
jgi:malonate decarboxylase delta subunit